MREKETDEMETHVITALRRMSVAAARYQDRLRTRFGRVVIGLLSTTVTLGVLVPELRQIDKRLHFVQD